MYIFLVDIYKYVSYNIVNRAARLGMAARHIKTKERKYEVLFKVWQRGYGRGRYLPQLRLQNRGQK